jgi:hypothetical protein
MNLHARSDAWVGLERSGISAPRRVRRKDEESEAEQRSFPAPIALAVLTSATESLSSIPEAP